MKRTKTEVETTRTALLDSAEILFCKQGVARASVLDIAKGAELTRGAFYHHFRDKAEVLVALIARARTEDFDPPPMPTSAEDPLQVLEVFFKALLRRFLSAPDQQRMFAILMQGGDSLGELEPLARSRRQEVFRSVDAYGQFFELARAQGRLSPTWEPRTAATTTYTLVFGLLDQWLRNPESLDLPDAGDACLEQLFASFRKAD